MPRETPDGPPALEVRQEAGALVFYGESADAWLATDHPIDLMEAR
jgi:hypothetical protein